MRKSDNKTAAMCVALFVTTWIFSASVNSILGAAGLHMHVGYWATLGSLVGLRWVFGPQHGGDA